MTRYLRLIALISTLAALTSCGGEDTPLDTNGPGPDPEPSVRWTTLASGKTLSSVWVDCAGTAWAVGEGGIAFYSDGNGWLPAPAGSSADLYGIWGNGSGKLFAVGEAGTVAIYDGSWTISQAPVSTDLLAVWGLSSSEVYAVGRSGRILRYDSSGWDVMDSPATVDLNAVHGISGSYIVAVGNNGMSFTMTARNGQEYIRHGPLFIRESGSMRAKTSM